MSIEIRELSGGDLHHVVGGALSTKPPTGHPSTGPYAPIDPGHGPVVLPGHGPIVPIGFI